MGPKVISSEAGPATAAGHKAGSTDRLWQAVGSVLTRAALLIVLIAPPVGAATVRLDPGDTGLHWVEGVGFRPVDGIDLFPGKYECPRTGRAFKDSKTDRVMRERQCGALASDDDSAPLTRISTIGDTYPVFDRPLTGTGHTGTGHTGTRNAGPRGTPSGGGGAVRGGSPPLLDTGSSSTRGGIGTPGSPIAPVPPLIDTRSSSARGGIGTPGSPILSIPLPGTLWLLLAALGALSFRARARA